MSTKLSVLLCVAVLLALTVACVFCPVIASADDTTPNWGDESQYFDRAFRPVNDINFDNLTTYQSLLALVNKAYKIGLFSGGVPAAIAIENFGAYTAGYYEIYVLAVSPQLTEGVPEESPKTNVYAELSGSSLFAYDGISGSVGNSKVYTLLANGCWSISLTNNSYLSLTTSRKILYTRNTNGTWGNNWGQNYWMSAPSNDVTTIHSDINRINGAYDYVLSGGSVGGSDYDDGYQAGYDVGYGDGWTLGIQTGYAEGNADGYEAGYEDGYETGYDDGHGDGFTEGWTDGRDEGLEIGKDLGYREGYDDGFDTGYETGYWEGWDDGYDDGYVQGDIDATSYTIDIPSVITSVPQSAKAIINNAFGFELFGINVAGLLSVLLIVAIIGFVVRWLMSR